MGSACCMLHLNGPIQRSVLHAASIRNLQHATGDLVPPLPVPPLAKKFACRTDKPDYHSPMALTSVYLAEEALSLPPEQRQQLANLLLDSLKADSRSDEELRDMLRSRLADLESGRDPGLTFDDVFGEKP
jgi:putative addiction module component (TIGR02574 family)